MCRVCFFVSMVLFLMVGNAYAIEIYGVNNLPAGAGTSNSLIRFDSASPATWVTVGSMNQVGVGFAGLDFDGLGSLFAYAGFMGAPGGTSSGLYSVDTTTGNATLVGNSGQSLQDLAWNPTNKIMYGINATGNVATLYTVNLANGATSAVGNFAGLPAINLAVGLAIDSLGNFFVQDLVSDMIYKGAGLNLTTSMPLSRNTSFSQGMTVDWSGDNQGYHAAIGNTPDLFSHLYGFDTALTSWNDLGTFGVPDGSLPTVQAGDIAIKPNQTVPEPASVVLLALGALALLRRRSA